ncbi:MAG TPA: methionyl-tRNA formyltransferase [Steroidobacteraceae bacterium]|nr:methionyl-tRNA formyltransferase [Steroidobacteraceae bacterium]
MRIVFAGTPDFSVPALDALHAAGHEITAVYTQPDRPAGRGQSLNESPVKRRAIELGLPLEQPATLRTTEAAADLAAYRPELMVVVAYGLILPPAILGVPRLGCWNIHASLLPRWRGAAPIQRAILAADTTTGITIMQMDAGLDTGPMLLVRPLPIGARESGGQLHDRLAALGADSIVAAIEQCLAGRLEAVRQPEEGESYAAKIRKQEAVIDWRQSAAQIDRQVRAFNPWPVAETRWQGQQLRIWEAESVAADGGVEPGRVLEAKDGRLLVAAGEGALQLRRVQLAGRRAMMPAEFLNAHPLAGARLGE